MLKTQILVSQDLDSIPIPPGNLDVSAIKNLLNTDRPVILEIGANCGQTTIKFIENFPNAIIHCFEPDPRAIKKFKLLVNHPNVFLHEIAIGITNGFIEFHQSAGGENIDPEGWDHSGSAKHPKAHLEMFPWVRFDNKIQVPIMKLDYWAQRNGISNIDFIWADVQGVEEDLIKGGEEILKRTRFIYTEHYDNECYSGQIKFDQLYQLLNRFLILKKYGNDVLLKNYFANKLLPSNIEGKFISDAISSGEFHLYLHHFDADPEFIYSDY